MKGVWLEHLVADARYALRGMRRSPGFYTTAVLMLALGIGLNAAIFSVFSHVLLAPLQFPDSGNLYVVSSHAASLGDARRLNSGPDFRDYRDQNTVFTGVAAAIGYFSEVWTGGGEPRVVSYAAGTQEFFNVLGVHAYMGRLFTPEEFKSLQNSTIVISYKFWKNQLGGDPHVLGRKLRIEDVSSEIVGVMPPIPDLYPYVDVWAKLTTEPAWSFMDWRANKFLDVFARLKPGVTRSAAEQQLTAILRRGEGEPNDVQVQLTPLKEYLVGPVERQLGIIMAAVGLVLLVTCLNTAALLLSRAVKRAPELAVRLGLGASHGRIRQQLLVEGLLLSMAGGVLGLALAAATVGLVQRVPGVTLPRVEGLHLNLAAVATSALIVLLASAVFALLPSAMLVKLDLASGLRTGRTGTSGAQRRPFAALIIAEVACAVVLTVCAGLLVRSFVRVQSLDLGYQPDKVLSAYLRTNFDSAKGLPFWRNVLQQAAGVPGAAAAAVSDCIPSARANGATLLFSDRANDSQHAPAAEGCWISADYFRALGTPLVRGRYFSEHDNDSAPPVVIINADAAKRFFPNTDPIGKRIAVNYLSLGSRVVGPPRFREIVGIVANSRQKAVEEPSAPAVYVPYEQDESFHVLMSMFVFVRSSGPDPAALGQTLRVKIQAVYPNQPVERIAVMREVVSKTLGRRTYGVTLMSSFAGLALLLCALGIYGVVSYVTAQRTKEFGIRMALGAQRWNVVCNVLQQGGLLIVAGGVIGMALCVPATSALSQLLFETAPLDPIIFSAAALLLAVIGVTACLLPGLRASQLDPREALAAD